MAIDLAGKVKIAPWKPEADAINYLLELRYGKDQVRNQPQYRLSWSTTETERRFGTYHVYYMQHIFLREERGELEVPKYPDFPDCWVLENFIYAPVMEIPETKNGHYEILYPFLSPKREPLEPLFRVCEIVIWCQRNPHQPGELYNILSERDKKLFQKEVAYFEDILEDRSGSWIVSALHDREAVTVPKNYERPDKVIIPGVISSTKGEL